MAELQREGEHLKGDLGEACAQYKDCAQLQEVQNKESPDDCANRIVPSNSKISREEILQQLQADIVRSQDNYRKAHAQISREEILQQLQADIVRSQDNYRKAHAQLMENEERLLDMKVQLTTLQGNHKESMEQLGDNLQQVAILRTKMSETLQQNQALSEDLSNYEQEIHQLKSELKKMQDLNRLSKNEVQNKESPDDCANRIVPSNSKMTYHQQLECQKEKIQCPVRCGEVDVRQIQLRASNSKTRKFDDDYMIPTKDDLQKLNKLLGGSWRVLFSLIVTGDNQVMVKDELQAERNLYTYFANVSYNLKEKKEVPPNDVTLRDIVTRIDHLLASDIHWLCSVNSLKRDKGHNDLLSDIYSLLPDFDSFWSALSMPHYDGKRDRLQANDPISNELKELEEDINSINVPEDLQDPEKFKEDKKFSFFLEKQYLVSYAKSLNLDQYCSKFQMLSEINIKKGDWESYINEIGITAVRRKKSADHFCVMYFLENKYLLGQKITSEYGGVGSLGYIFYKDGAMNLMTSSHILLDEAIFKKMEKNQKEFLSLKNQCQIEGIGNAVIRQGVYSEGDDQFAGVEIVFFDIRSVPYFQSNHFRIPTGHYGPVPVPSLQDAYGTVSVCPQSVTGTTGSDCPPFDTSKMGSTRPASFDTDSKIEGTYLDKPVIDGSIFRPMGHLYYQWKRHDFPDHLCFKGNFREDIEIDSEVYILGAVTGLTKGKIIQTDFTFEADYQSLEKLKDKIIRSVQSFFKITIPKPQLLLKKQIVVKWESYEFPFSKKGDSGAPVFQITKDTGELTAVGILTGNNTTLQVSYVTPIKDILHICQANGPSSKLGHFDLRLIEQDKDVQKKRFSDLCRKLGIE